MELYSHVPAEIQRHPVKGSTIDRVRRALRIMKFTRTEISGGEIWQDDDTGRSVIVHLSPNFLFGRVMMMDKFMDVHRFDFSENNENEICLRIERFFDEQL